MFGALACAFTPTLSLYAQHLGASPLQIGLLFSFPALLGVFIRVPAGALSTIIGRKKVLLLGSGIGVLAPIFLVFSHHLIGLFLSMLFYGLIALYLPAALSLVHDVIPKSEKEKYLGNYSMISGIGRVIGPLLAGIILNYWNSYTMVFWVCSVWSFLSFILLLTLSVPRSPSSSSLEKISLQIFKDLKTIGSQPLLKFSIVMRFLLGFLMGILFTYFPLYAQDVAGFNPSQIGFILSSLTFFSLLTRGVFGKFKCRKGRTFWIVASASLSGFILFILGQGTSFPFLLVFCSLIGIAEGICYLTTLSFISDFSGDYFFGAAIGMAGAASDLGMIGGRFCPGFLLSLLTVGSLSQAYAITFGLLGGFVGLVSVSSYFYPLESRASSVSKSHF